MFKAFKNMSIEPCPPVDVEEWKFKFIAND